MLTRVLSKVMKAIEQMDAQGLRPTQRALADMTGRNSHSRVSCNVDMLEERGFVRRDPDSGTVVLIRTIADETRGTPVSDDPMVRYVHAYQVENDGVSPSHSEIAGALGISSKSLVNGRIMALIDQGHLEAPVSVRKEKMQRCLRVVKT